MINYLLLRIFRSLAGKLILSIGILILVGGGISWYLLISSGKKELMNDALENAASYSELVIKSTRYDMITFHREAIQQIIEEVSSRKEILGLRIYDGMGQISYSSDKSEIGHGTGLGLSITEKSWRSTGGSQEQKAEKGAIPRSPIYFPYQSDEESLQTKCWEYMKCGRDRHCSLKCPAFPNFGRICWAVAGTFCEGKVQGTFAQKYDDCKKCEFYQKVREKEEAK